MKTSILALCVLLTLTGCTLLGPKYDERPVSSVLGDASVADDIRGDALPRVTAVPAPKIDTWWNRFGDSALTRLLAKAYAANRTLEGARANLRAARAAYQYERGALWPTVDVGGTLTHTRASDNTLAFKRRMTDYTLSGDASWEIDLFGRQQHLVDAAEAEAEASEAQLRNMWVSVSSEIALRYLELRTLQARLSVAEDNLRVQQETYDILADRYAGGIGDALAKYQAEYNLRSTAATIPNLQAQVATCENTLAILCGVTPGTLPGEIVTPPRLDGDRANGSKPRGLSPSGIPQPDPINLEDGIPADAIRRRPDVIAAERTLKASVDTLGNAMAERYPRVYISGSLGLEALHVGDVLDWDSHFYRFGPGVSLPIFRGGQINANIEIKTEQQKAALADYENTVLTALGDIRNALSDYRRGQERLFHLREAVKAASQAYEVANDKYNKGLTDFNNVLDAQRNLLSLDESRVISEGAIAEAQVKVYKALCGGWDGAESPELAEYFFGEAAVPEPLLAPIATPSADGK